MQAALGFQQQTGVHLQETWLSDITSNTLGSQLDLQSFWGAFLACDLNQAGAGSLPAGLKVVAGAFASSELGDSLKHALKLIGMTLCSMCSGMA